MASDVYCPITGEVIAINEDLTETPETVNQDSFDTGWLFKMQPEDAGEVDELMDAEAYAELLATPWPGPVEWHLRNRRANCLAKLGRTKDAFQEREKASEVASRPRNHRRIRVSLLGGETPQVHAGLKRVPRAKRSPAQIHQSPP